MNEDSNELIPGREEDSQIRAELTSALKQINELNAKLKKLKVSTYPYKKIFEGIAVSIWEADLTQTRDILLELKTKYGKLAACFEIYPGLIKEIFGSIKILDINSYTLKHFKAKDKQELYGGISKLLTDENQQMIFDLIYAIADGEESFTGETLIPDFEGNVYPAIVNVCFHNGDFDYKGVIVGIVDVSLHKESEEEIKRSEERLRTILKAIPDMIFLFDRDGFFLDYYANEPYKMAMSPPGFPGHHIRDIFPVIVVEKVLSAFNNSLQTGDIQVFEFELEQTGSNTFFEYRIVPAGPDEVIALATDISLRKKAEKVKEATYRISELAITAFSLVELYKSIHQIIGELMPANNIYIALYDHDTNSLSFPYFIDENDTVPATRKLRKGLTEYVLRTGKPLLTNPVLINRLVSKGEIEIIGTLTYDWLGVPLKTKERIIGVLVVQSYRDDVRYTDSDKEMLIFVSSQVAMAIERRISEEELKRAKVTAEESSKLKSTLLANLSHEFRTPMNGILNYARLLRENLAGDSKAEMAETIYASGDRLMSTLDSIMNLAQIEASNIKLEISKVDIGKAVYNTILHFETEAQEKGLIFEFKAADYIFAYCDVTLINQITRYLLDNAVKFTKLGKISVFVRSTMLGGKSWAELEIRDTGIGISKQDMEVIFHEFRQVSSGYGRTHEGSGLGLTLCKKMSELMNGRIIVESTVGKGSSFYLRLPQAKDAGVEINTTSQTTQPYIQAPRIRSNPSPAIHRTGLAEVLIVEDNQVNMELTVMFLSEVCNTDKAKDGLAAIKLASSKIYDAILMDINLGPGMNGLETAMEIRKIPGYENTPIVAVTGYTLSGDREKMLQGGCTHYLPKPFDKKGILNMINEVLGRKENS